MPYYYFEAVTAEGKIQKKLLKARDKTDADTRLRASGLRPMLIESYRAKKKKTKNRNSKWLKQCKNKNGKFEYWFAD